MRYQEDYAFKAQKFQGEAERISKYNTNYPLISQKFLNAANFWRSSLKQNRDFKQMFLSKIKDKMEYCYSQALSYAVDKDKRKLIQQEKNYSQVYLKELDLRKELQSLESKYKGGKGKIISEDLNELNIIGIQYRKLAMNLDIPEIYREYELKDLNEKAKKIQKIVQEAKTKNEFFSDVFLEDKFPHKGKSLESLTYAIISISLFVVSLIFVSVSFTGNVIGGINENYSRIISICFFVCGLIFTFFYLRKGNSG